MADPVKMPTAYEEDIAVKERGADQVEEEEARGGRLRGLRERRAGFFREHPRAKYVIAVVALLLIAGVVFVWHYYSVRESTDDAQIDGHINPIGARVTGTVIRVLHDDNDLVKAGELLVELDPKDYQVALDRAKADLANAEANAVAANVGVPLTTTTSSSSSGALCGAERRAERSAVRARSCGRSAGQLQQGGCRPQAHGDAGAERRGFAATV